MIEEDYGTYKEMYFEVFPASNLEGMAKELHSALIAYQYRLRQFEAFQQSVERTLESLGVLPEDIPNVEHFEPA
jgi:hypothetical protein